MSKTKDFSYEIVEDLGVISVGEKGWTKRLRIVKWGDNKPTYDIRNWKEDNKKIYMSKGITFTKEELKVLSNLIKGVI